MDDGIDAEINGLHVRNDRFQLLDLLSESLAQIEIYKIVLNRAILYYELAVMIKERHGPNTDSCTLRGLTLRVHGCLEVHHAL